MKTHVRNLHYVGNPNFLLLTQENLASPWPRNGSDQFIRTFAQFSCMFDSFSSNSQSILDRLNQNLSFCTMACFEIDWYHELKLWKSYRMLFSSWQTGKNSLRYAPKTATGLIMQTACKKMTMVHVRPWFIRSQITDEPGQWSLVNVELV